PSAFIIQCSTPQKQPAATIATSRGPSALAGRLDDGCCASTEGVQAMMAIAMARKRLSMPSLRQSDRQVTPSLGRMEPRREGLPDAGFELAHQHRPGLLAASAGDAVRRVTGLDGCGADDLLAEDRVHVAASDDLARHGG